MLDLNGVDYGPPTIGRLGLGHPVFDRLFGEREQFLGNQFSPMGHGPLPIRPLREETTLILCEEALYRYPH